MVCREGTQTSLCQLVQSLESYYHPANIGRHSVKLTEFMAKLADAFIRRLHRERHKPPAWGFSQPAEHRLSDQDIDRWE